MILGILITHHSRCDKNQQEKITVTAVGALANNNNYVIHSCTYNFTNAMNIKKADGFNNAWSDFI